MYRSNAWRKWSTRRCDQKVHTALNYTALNYSVQEQRMSTMWKQGAPFPSVCLTWGGTPAGQVYNRSRTPGAILM